MWVFWGQSIVLLKNEGQVLPLKKGSSVAVLGPHSDGHDVFLSSKHQEPSFRASRGESPDSGRRLCVV